MLSAQKQQMPSDTPPEESRAPTATGFGRVLNSIQGLQQRLDDFSVEEVSRAHAQAHSLIRELNDLQSQLNELAKLKDALLSVDAEIAAIPENNFDLVGLDSLENHPQLRAIVQAGKLIRMQRMLRAAQASAESSFDLQPTTPSSHPLPTQTKTISNASAPTIEPPAETPLAISAEANTEMSSQADERFALPGSLPITHNPNATPTYDFADLKLEATRETASARKDDSSQPSSGHNRGPSRKSKKAKGKPQIDRRLLNDVIETYGEFAISIEPAARAKAIEALPAPATEQVASTSTELVSIESRREPAFVQPAASSARLGLPAPDQERQEPVFDGPSPSVKSQGEIDRQLKNIIKDYGEYDLYSQRKTINVKTAVIAAVAGLALVLGSVYLFKAPSSPAPAAIETSAPAEGSAAEVSGRSSNSKQNQKN